MLVLIPARCNCTTTVSWLIGVVATRAHAKAFLIYTTSTSAEVGRLYLHLDRRIRAKATLALESDNLLRDSIPDSFKTDGLTAILVGHGASAYYATRLTQHDDPTTLIRALRH
jgi:flagellar motor component MotA